VTVIAFTAAKGAPGVSTTVLGLGLLWPQIRPDRRVLVVEADPSGGEAAVGLLRGQMDASRGLLALAAMRGVDPVTALWSQLVSLDDDQRLLVLLGLTDPSRSAALDGAWTALAEAIAIVRRESPDLDVLLDLGRLGQAHDPRGLRRLPDRLVLVTGSSAANVVAARAAVRRLRDETPAPLGLLVTGPDRPYPAADVAEACEVSLVGSLPFDPAGALGWLTDNEGWRSRRSPLGRALRALSLSLADVEPLATAGGVR
jgi:hypothetical protein